MVGVHTIFRSGPHLQPTRAGSSVAEHIPLTPREVRPCPLSHEPVRSPRRELTDDEKHLAKLGYSQELSRSWSSFSNFAISFSIISILAGCFTTFGPGLEQRRPDRDLVGLADHLGLHPASSASRCRELVSAYPTSGGIYWWAAKLGGPAAGLLHRLAQPDRPPRGDRERRLRARDVPRPDDQHHQHELGRRLLADAGVPALRGDPGARVGAQHLQRPPARRHQQHLGVVARRRCRDRDPGADHRPADAPELRLRLHRADQQLRLRAAALYWFLVAAARLPAHPVHDHRVRRLGPPVRGDRRARPRARPRASGARSSTPPSVATSCCSRSSSRSQDPQGVERRLRRGGRDLRPGAARRAGTS